MEGTTTLLLRVGATFEEVYPVVLNYARKVLKDEEIIAIAIVLAWWFWRNAKKNLPASVWAQCGVRAALQGRDLPGVLTNAKDVWRKLHQWQGGGMNLAVDKKPGPERVVLNREAFGLLLKDASPRERELILLMSEDWGQGTKDLAEELGCSQGNVSQLRRKVFEKASE